MDRLGFRRVQVQGGEWWGRPAGSGYPEIVVQPVPQWNGLNCSGCARRRDGLVLLLVPADWPADHKAFYRAAARLLAQLRRERGERRGGQCEGTFENEEQLTRSWWSCHEEPTESDDNAGKAGSAPNERRKRA